MVTEQFVEQRKGRTMAQLLEEFERTLEPILPADVSEDFKALVRRKLNVFASDVVEQIRDDQKGLTRRNGVGQALRDSLHADGPEHG